MVAAGVKRKRARITTSKTGKVTYHEAKIVRNKKADKFLIFAKEVRGFIWHGKLQEVKDAMIRAFTAGIKSFKGDSTK